MTFAGTLADGLHQFSARQTEPGKGPSTSASLAVRIDTEAPAASFSTQTPAQGEATFDFTIVYNDLNSLVDPATLGNDDVTVIGPDNATYVASLIDAGVPGSGGNRTVTYRINAPGGTWDGADAGTYSVAQNADGVADVAGNFRAAGEIGTFTVAASFAYLVGNDLHVDYLASGNVVALLANGANVDVTQGATTASFANASFDSIILHGTDGNDTLDFTGPIAQPITFDGGAGDDQLNVLGGTFSFAADAATDCDALGVNVAAGAAVIFDATQHLRDLDIDGTATLSPGGAKVIVTKALSVAGRLNLTDNDLVLDYEAAGPNPLNDVHARLASAYRGSAWDGPGIGTDMAAAKQGRTTLGVVSAAGRLSGGATAMFSGVTVDASSVLIKYTYAGDANLDGQIDAGDYGVIDNFVQVSNASGYFNGDFNYDGFIDAGDYGIIDNNVQAQGTPL
jgi:hypothetical protein